MYEEWPCYESHFSSVYLSHHGCVNHAYVSVHNINLETSATILNSLASSPLILAGTGFLHEACVARIVNLRSRREWVVVGFYHSIIATALVLVVIGIVNIVKGLSTTQNSGLIKAGLATLIVSYVALIA